ncbi:MAG TPA: glycosyltransferase [Solirubrobacteraceae bacterium]|nr:glycosyltransferase [Solirubrobacteraceae bacterium]
MALRLTGTTLQPSAESPAGQLRHSAQSLALQGRTALAADDVAAYAALFGPAAEIEDPHRRLEAQLALLEVGLTGSARASEGTATRLFVAVADAALRMLESEPSEPFVLNLAGVACYELWSLDAAYLLFKAARRLDPGLADAARNLEEVARRRRTAGRRTRPLHAAVPGLARRAQSVANRARPASGLTLSLCMIVRDEERMLPRCLAAAAPAVDEIVIVDTGSTDATIEIARSFGARVIEHPWTGSFAEARNVSFEAATGDWVMYLDADEVLVAEDVTQLRALTGHTWREAFYVVETSYTGELGDGGAIVNNALRIFRNRPDYRFRDRLHEQILHTLPTYLPGRVEQTPVRLQHYGYLGSVREAKEKSRRNVELLRRQAAEGPPTAFLHFNLGSEYIITGELADAVDHLQRAHAMLVAEGSMALREFVPALMVRLVMALRMCGRLSEARAAAAEGLQLFPELTDLVVAQARIAQALGDPDEAVRLYHRAIELGDAPARYGASVGSGTIAPRLALAELALERGDATTARGALEWCLDNRPDFLAVAGPYVTALVRDGVPAADAVGELARLDSLPPQVHLTVATALRSLGAAAEAEAQYALALAAAPDDGAARVGLAELLLARGAWAEAAEQAMLVAEDDPHAALSARIALCGLIGRGDDTAVAAALARADRTGLPAAERTVFGAWAGIARGEPAPEGLPVGGMPLLGVILETLMGGGDGERFTALLPALTQSRLARREQRELLAGMFLTHGLLDRAAQEWMAACSPEPDARALLGLARVAMASGMTEDAATFATGALELDPACAPARELLAGLATQPLAAPRT